MKNQVKECPLCQSNITSIIVEKLDKLYGRRIYWFCELCHLVFMDSRYHLLPEAEKNRYDLSEVDRGDDAYTRFLEHLAVPMIDVIPPGAVGLDYGSGPSTAMAELFNSRGFYMYSFDPYYMNQVGLLDKQYDFIVCSEVIEHFYSPRQNFDRLDKLLKKGGYLGIRTQFRDPNEEFKTWHFHRDPTHVSFYEPYTLQWIGVWKGWSLDFPAGDVAIFRKP